MLGIIYRTWVLARQDEIQDDAEDRRVAKTPSFDAEDDSVVPVETSEFPLTMIGTDGQSVSDVPAGADAIVKVADRVLDAKAAASEEQPGSLNVTPPGKPPPSKEGGGQ
jgi:multicomponent Na+:H+ antiporter subunit C